MKGVQTNGALGSAHVQGNHKSGKFKKETSQFGEETRLINCSRKLKLVSLPDNFIGWQPTFYLKTFV